MRFVYGLGKNGISVVKYFTKIKKNFHCWDDDINARKKIKKLIKNIKLINPNKHDLNRYKKIILSPGISYKKNNLIKIKNYKDKLERDLNLYCEYNSDDNNIIAVTGTNGKSTTTKLIGDIFKQSKKTTFVGGNIGKPLLNSFLSNKKYAYNVIELSSFQLEFVKNFNPTVAILLNLSKDHLDRYKSNKDYINQKKKIFSKKGFGYNLISLDDNESIKLYKDKKIINKISFSISKSTANIYFKGNYINDNYFFKNKKILIEKISPDLKGSFNNQNILASYIVSRLFNISSKTFKDSIRNFKGLPHRNNIIKQNEKFIAINNSKATNVESTYKSLLNYNNVYLILGGRAKEKNFIKIKKLHKKVNKVFVYGESADLISKQIQSKMTVFKFEKLNEIIKKIFNDIKDNSKKITVLFAPGCTSFDQYKNFEERGIHFIKLINQYSDKKK